MPGPLVHDRPGDVEGDHLAVGGGEDQLAAVAEVVESSQVSRKPSWLLASSSVSEMAISLTEAMVALLNRTSPVPGSAIVVVVSKE